MLAVQVVWVDAQAQVQERSVALPPAPRSTTLRACGLEPGTHAACGVWGAPRRWTTACRTAIVWSCTSR